MSWQLFDRKGDRAAYRRHGGPIKRRHQTDKIARFFFLYFRCNFLFVVAFWVTSRLDQISTAWDMFHQVSIQISCDSAENWCATLLLVATHATLIVPIKMWLHLKKRNGSRKNDRDFRLNRLSDQDSQRFWWCACMQPQQQRCNAITHLNLHCIVCMGIVCNRHYDNYYRSIWLGGKCFIHVHAHANECDDVDAYEMCCAQRGRPHFGELVIKSGCATLSHIRIGKFVIALRHQLIIQRTSHASSEENVRKRGKKTPNAGFKAKISIIVHSVYTADARRHQIADSTSDYGNNLNESEH